MSDVPTLNGLWIALLALSALGFIQTMRLGEAGRLTYPWATLSTLALSCALVWVSPVLGLVALLGVNWWLLRETVSA